MNYLKECDTVSLIGIIIAILFGFTIGMLWKSDLEDYEPFVESTEEDNIRWKQPDEDSFEPVVAEISIEPCDMYCVAAEDLSRASLEPEQSYTDKELETLAHLLWAEAGNCSDETIYAVASVVWNRIQSDKYPDNLIDVIYQKGQYSPTRHGFMKRKPSQKCYDIASDVLENGSVIPEGVLGQANKTIYKRYGKRLYKKLDGIYFFYL